MHVKNGWDVAIYLLIIVAFIPIFALALAAGSVILDEFAAPSQLTQEWCARHAP